MSHSIINVALKYEDDVVAARQRARQIAGLIGFEAQDQTRIATAVSEIARNAFRYARNGIVEFLIEGQTDVAVETAASYTVEAIGGRTPAVYSGRSPAALALLELAEREEARRLADEEVELARQWGAPRGLGKALRTAGLAEGGEAGLALLREAAEVLEDSPAVLERARALTELGAALRRSNRRADARDPLRRGLELAHSCGAKPLAERAHAELVATGARPRRLVLTGLDSLTPSERRVAAMAAEGMTNRDVAQALFVTPRTVEMHLSSVYRKLGISSRSQLPQALDPPIENVRRGQPAAVGIR